MSSIPVEYPPPTLLTLPLIPQAEWNRRLRKQLQAVVLKYRVNGKVSALEPRSGAAYEEICASRARAKGGPGRDRDARIHRLQAHLSWQHCGTRRPTFTLSSPGRARSRHTLGWSHGCADPQRGPTGEDSCPDRFLRLLKGCVHSMQVDSLAISERNCGWCM